MDLATTVMSGLGLWDLSRQHWGSTLNGTDTLSSCWDRDEHRRVITGRHDYTYAVEVPNIFPYVLGGDSSARSDQYWRFLEIFFSGLQLPMPIPFSTQDFFGFVKASGVRSAVSGIRGPLLLPAVLVPHRKTADDFGLTYCILVNSVGLRMATGHTGRWISDDMYRDRIC